MDFDLSKQFARKLSIMIESGLICYKHYYLWCDEIIEESENPPYWVIELGLIKYYEHAAAIVKKYVFSEPFMKFDGEEGVDLYIACLYLRYLRRELSWASFLELSGNYSDGYSGKKECEYFYILLNQFEDSEFSLDTESKQNIEILSEFEDEIKEIEVIYKTFEPYFRQYVKNGYDLNC